MACRIFYRKDKAAIPLILSIAVLLMIALLDIVFPGDGVMEDTFTLTSVKFNFEFMMDTKYFVVVDFVAVWVSIRATMTPQPQYKKADVERKKTGE